MSPRNRWKKGHCFYLRSAWPHSHPDPSARHQMPPRARDLRILASCAASGPYLSSCSPAPGQVPRCSESVSPYFNVPTRHSPPALAVLVAGDLGGEIRRLPSALSTTSTGAASARRQLDCISSQQDPGRTRCGKVRRSDRRISMDIRISTTNRASRRTMATLREGLRI